jgi:alkylation response protein AidB-like acyl-CoA dehydrogenase
MLGAFVPTELGGRGATIADLAGVCEVLGRFCASTAMIWPMHQIEVACLVRHARVPVLPRLPGRTRMPRMADRVRDLGAWSRRSLATQRVRR